MKKVSSSLEVLAEKSRKKVKFGISPRRKFENANLMAEDFSLFPCLHKYGGAGGFCCGINLALRINLSMPNNNVMPGDNQGSIK